MNVKKINLDQFLELDLEYLQPTQSLLLDINHTDDYIYSGVGKKALRKIYQQVEYSPFENDHISEFKNFLKNEQIGNLGLEKLEQSDYLKLLYSGKFNIKTSLQFLKSHIQWKNSPQYFYINENSKKYLEKGLIYLQGRDKQLRPIIVINCLEIPTDKKEKENVLNGICIFLNMIKRHMFIPGKVENWIFIIDTFQMSLLDIPLKIISSMIQIMQLNFAGCLEKLLILNPSNLLKWSWKLIEKFIDEQASKKIKFFQINKLNPKNPLPELIDNNNLQEKYGGSLKDNKQFWPPCKETFDLRCLEQYQQEQQQSSNQNNLQICLINTQILEQNTDQQQNTLDMFQQYISQQEKNYNNQEQQNSCQTIQDYNLNNLNSEQYFLDNKNLDQIQENNCQQVPSSHDFIALSSFSTLKNQQISDKPKNQNENILLNFQEIQNSVQNQQKKTQQRINLCGFTIC